MSASYSTGIVHSVFDHVAVAMANGRINLFTAPRPANADSPATGSVLGQVTKGGGPFTPGSPLNGINFGTAANRGIDKNPAEVWQFTALASGVASWFRHYSNAADTDGASTTNLRIDGSIASFGAEGQMADTNIVAGKTYVFNGARLNWNGI